MKKTKIAFEDIQAGDLLEVTIVDCGVKYVLTGIAYEFEVLEAGSFDPVSMWNTSDGGMIVADEEDGAVIYRIDVREVGFGDVRQGDRIRVTTKVGNYTTIIEAEASHPSSFGEYWLDATGHVLNFTAPVSSDQFTVEIVERKGD